MIILYLTLSQDVQFKFPIHKLKIKNKKKYTHLPKDENFLRGNKYLLLIRDMKPQFGMICEVMISIN